MSKLVRSLILAALVAFAAAPPAAMAQQPAGVPATQERLKRGHSVHGAAFDSGPRQKPWAMDGLGVSHFPVTTSSPEAQKWFDQGNTLLHSFWYYEAERAFRWVLKLDPECAMAYWGLARSVDEDRASAFIREASKRKAKVTDRERRLIEIWEEDLTPPIRDTTMGQQGGESRSRLRRERLEKLCLDYPDDVEILALYALENIGNDNRFGNELIIERILARAPDHPGAHHYRIHTWDGPEGARALSSCRRYPEVSPLIGHAQHMPGHIQSQIGMWHEAAISMDAATRVEQAYLKRRLVFPFNTWNYAHNRNYLCYIQEQLGMEELAVRGSRELLASPFDPTDNNPDRYSAHWQGTIALSRALIRFARWKEILAPDTFAWREQARDKMYRTYSEGLAHIGLGDLRAATISINAHSDLKAEIEKSDAYLAAPHAIQSLELRAKHALARGQTLEGIGLLSDAARREAEYRLQNDDPPGFSYTLYTELGRTYLAKRSLELAVIAFEKSLEVTPNDGFALAGLAEAYSKMGERERSTRAYARLLHVWAGADPGLADLVRARALGLSAQPVDDSPGPQRLYQSISLDHFGPRWWESYQAPALDAVDSKSKRVTLEEYRGKNVLLIFYLGRECPHCVVQLREVSKRKDELAELNTIVLAVSSDTPEENAEALALAEVAARLLSDPLLANARRFNSYDDFEETDLHSTILIDREGRVHWARTGGEPFRDLDFIVREIKRMNVPTPKS